MPTTTTEQQRELLRGAYTQGVLANSPSECVRFKALRRLAQIVGILRVLPVRPSSVTPAPTAPSYPPQLRHTRPSSVIPALAAGISP